MDHRLPRQFYLQETTEVARQLLGKKLVRTLPSGLRLSGMIIETEAYLGAEDPACHSYGNRLTPRTAPMFEEGGIAYVYFIYGMYHCFNVVTRAQGQPEAVLIRAVELLEHPEASLSLANGPGKLCRALAIDKTLNHLSLNSDHMFVAEHALISEQQIADSPRIG